MVNVDTEKDSGVRPEGNGVLGRRDKVQDRKTAAPRDPFIRAENEDDDGYDPYSDRRPEREPLFERDPWS